jgi:hypothetical protein
MKNKYIKLTKLSDDVFGKLGLPHPNFINVGHVLAGWCVDEPIIGEQLYLYPFNKKEHMPVAWTSVLKNIDLENMVLKTKNSTYRIEIINEDETISALTKRGNG